MAFNVSGTTDYFRREGSDPALGLALAGLLAAALVFGGRSHALQYGIVSLAALPALFLLLREPRRRDWLGVLLLGLVALAALQLVPLPPPVWRALAGHDLIAATLDAVGLGQMWRPISVAPWATFAALLGLLAPVTAFFAARRAGWAAVRTMLAAAGLFAAASALLGVAQRLTGGLNIYHAGHEGFATGLFGNRNHLADLILTGVATAPLLAPPEKRSQWAIVLSVYALLLTLCVFATTSKAGLLLAGPVLAASLFMIWRPQRRHYVGAAAVFLVIVAAVLSLKGLDPVLQRFADPGAAGDRAIIIDTAPVAIRAFWPWGSGYGTFVPVYAAFEDLDLVQPAYVIEAHNDYLQIALEGGLPGTISMLAGLAAIGWIVLALIRRRAPRDVLAPIAIIALLLAHSVVDYPLRMPALSVLFAVCCGSIDAVRQTFAKPRGIA
ncbi:O-antigen ligase family protein [Parablastomonas sp. CN1-191]|uniref:O-antigen ligase family protein n=1 Tax=Parablastomonas sp. CN1-191 TaxID=3400908 RepID=UPI003BF7EA6C